ncbi:ABC transporter permease [Lutispora saccharofermentans]|uniref:ABC transporter permease n=1 Tax=Lutispora saccharofermentans TaxID=3024236 RepID=A0ABT1NKF9_9FIRM|nr:ABC transporter permease [Lutispora saccharofermentans]MCQ1531752.1 ABC transporter permease [Lutispora saccharofermentans]
MWKSLKGSKTGILGAGIVLLVIFLAFTATIISPHDPAKQDIINKMMNPVWYEDGSWQHILGTDQLGRDILSRLIYGSRVTLMVAFSGTIFAGIIGITMGSISGYYGGWIDAIIMRIVDIQLSFPFILLALFIAAVLGPGLQNIILIAAISGWVRYARLVRGEILSIKEMEYIEAIRSLGGSNARIIFRHILPNVISPAIVIATLEMAKIILMEASLSYLGLGVPIEIPTWGRMLSDSRVHLVTSPWMAVLPGFAITLTVLGVNLLGDWLRDYLDPKLDF